MAIAKMNKFTLLTFHARKDALLKELQIFGDVHLKSLGQEEMAEMDFLQPDFSQEQLTRYEVELDKVRFAANKIAPYVAKSKLGARRTTLSFTEFDRYALDYDYTRVYEQVKEQDEAVAGIKADMARRRAENDSLTPWCGLDAAPKDLSELRSVSHLIGTVNKQAMEELHTRLAEDFRDVYLEELGAIKDDVALLLLCPNENYDDLQAMTRELGFSKVAFQFDDVPMQVIEANNIRIKELQGEQVAAEEAIAEMAEEHPKLQIALDYFATVLERERACQNFLRSETVVLIEGWVPAEEMDKLRGILDTSCPGEYFLEAQEVEKDSETVPIKLKNNGFVSAFESITSMYSMPHYNEIDPTPILAPFYWLFFGMMVGDMGYGLVMLIATSLVLWKIDLKSGMRNFMQFFRLLSVSVILMGVVYGGAFGVTIIKPIRYLAENGETLSKPILDSQADITTMLILSIIIGIVQILVGLGTKAYIGFRDGSPLDAFCDGIIWAITLLSGIGWLLGGSGIIAVGSLGVICKWVFFACLAGLVVTQGRSSPSLGGKIGNGLYGAYGLTSYVGDIVSYTRIVALALSGAYIAYAFNLMTSLVVGEFGAGNIVASVIRLIFGIIIIVFGQTLNLGLSLLGAYVHSCRLQYVEFFSKFYEGGGVVFRPLALKNEYIHINK